MTLFARTAEHLTCGPTVLLTADAPDAIAEAARRYDPAFRVRRHRFVFHNGLHLNGPVEVTPEMAQRTGLPPGMTAGYYATTFETGARGSRPDDLKCQDAERLIRGLAARLGGTVHDERPPMDLQLRASVYSAQSLAVDQVSSVLQAYVDTGELVIEDDADVKDAYYLVTEQEPMFFVVCWPPRLSRSRLALPPPAIGDLRDKEVCRWDLTTKFPAATAAHKTCLTVGKAALALARRADGIAVDTYGFAIERPEDLLPAQPLARTRPSR